MYIGTGIFLLVVGAIVTFVAPDRAGGFNIDMIGWILMGGGLLAILLSFVMARPRNATVQRRTEVADGRGGVSEQVETVERREH